MTAPLVEILYFEGCPNHEQARELIERVSARLGVVLDVRLLEVRDVAEAKEMRFLGSPTVRVDGVDVEPGTGTRNEFVVACRVYQTASGFQGQPDESWVVYALRKRAAG
jgi:hypothetical protein